MPTVTIPFIGTEYQTFIVSRPQSGIAHIQNDGSDHIYVHDPTVNSEWKVLAHTSMDIPIVRQTDYAVMVCGTVDVTWSVT